MDDEKIIAHTYPCGHTKRIKFRNAKKRKEMCWDCEEPLYRTKKRAEHNAQRRANPTRKPEPATSAQRQAQKQLVGIFSRNILVSEEGVVIQRNDEIIELATVNEIENSLRVLAVPYKKSQLTTVSGSSELCILWSDIELLAKWTPAAVRKAQEYYELIEAV